MRSANIADLKNRLTQYLREVRGGSSRWSLRRLTELGFRESANAAVDRVVPVGMMPEE